MTRSFFPVALAAVLLGCAARDAPALSSAERTTSHAPARAPESSMESNTAYFLLKDGSVHEGAAPDGLHVKGRLDNGQFIPEGDIAGEGPLADAGQPGWLELRDGSFHGDQTGRPPFPPYVRGYQTPDGDFRPSSRTVHY